MHCFMNRRSPCSNWVTLPHWMHRTTQSADAVSLFAPRCSGYSRKLLSRLAAATCSNSASRNSAQRLLEIAMHVIVTDQHCQRQASSCTDIASLDSCTPIVKVRTCCIGVKHNSCQLSQQTKRMPTSTVVSSDCLHTERDLLVDCAR